MDGPKPNSTHAPVRSLLNDLESRHRSAPNRSTDLSMILYDYFRSSAAYRVRIALNLKGLKAERRSIHLRKGEQRGAEYKAVNAQGLVPTLEIGGLRLTQSLAIIEYLDEKYPEPPLVPRDPEDRAFARAIAMTIECHIHPIHNTRVMQYLEHELGLEQAKQHPCQEQQIRL